MARKRKNGEGTVRLRKDGRWEGRVIIGYDEKNLPKTKNVLAKTKSECVEKLKQLQEQYAPPKSDKVKSDMPFGEWMDFWYQNYSRPKLRPTTRSGYEGRIYQHIIPEHLHSCDRRYAETGGKPRWRFHGRHFGRGVETVARKRKNGEGTVRLRKDGRWEGRVIIGYDEKNLPKTKNVLAKTKSECVEKLKQLQEQYAPPKSDKVKSDMPFGEWMDFWYQNYSRPKLRPTTRSGYEGRIYQHIIPELGSIPLNQLTQNDLQQFYVRLKQSGRLLHTEHYGEGLSDTMVRGSHANCRSALEKAVQVPPPLLNILKEYREGVNSRWMFPSPVKEDSPLDPAYIRTRLHLILEHAQCKQIRFHDLRHTFATIALGNGMDVKTLSAMLGHVSAATTLDIYTHITNPMRSEAAAKIDQKIGKAAPQESPVEPQEKQAMTTFQPYIGRKRKPGTGCITYIAFRKRKRIS